MKHSRESVAQGTKRPAEHQEVKTEEEMTEWLSELMRIPSELPDCIMVLENEQFPGFQSKPMKTFEISPSGDMSPTGDVPPSSAVGANMAFKGPPGEGISPGGDIYEVAPNDDIAEVFSPPRLVTIARRYGLKGSWSIDRLTEKEPGVAWDLSIRGHQSAVKKLLEAAKP